MTSKYIPKDFWNKKRVVVTGGAGFLGARVVQRLITLGASEVFVPRSINYNFVNAEDSIRLLKDTKPNIVMHLAAKVGGIGDNKLHPAEYFYENLMMGVQLENPEKTKELRGKGSISFSTPESIGAIYII